MIHATLCRVALQWLARQKCVVVFSETSGWETKESPDAWGIDQWGSTWVVEAKVSRADFLADKKKPWRADPGLGMGEYRTYITPAGLLKPSDFEALPYSNWGLLELHGKTVKIIRGFEPAYKNGLPDKVPTCKFPVVNRVAELQHLTIACRHMAAGHQGLVTCRAYKIASYSSTPVGVNVDDDFQVVTDKFTVPHGEALFGPESRP